MLPVPCSTDRRRHLGPSLLYMEFIQFPQWTGNPRPPELRTFSIIPLKIWFFEVKTPGFVWDFLGDHFARVESSGDQTLTMFILHFHVSFSSISDPQQKSSKSRVFENPSKPWPLGPCPDDRARNSVQDSLIESSVRPNPSLVFSKIRSQF